jgi:hypothetical protein
VIVSKNGKSYDTSDGSEQPREGSTPRGPGDARPASERWADDGGAPIKPPLVIVADLAWKPAWSVLSLRELNLAIRRERDELPARQLRAAEDAERARVHAVVVESDRLAAEARDRYRNAWETT